MAWAMMRSAPFIPIAGRYYTSPGPYSGDTASDFSTGAGNVNVTSFIWPYDPVVWTQVGLSVTASAIGKVFRIGIYHDTGAGLPGLPWWQGTEGSLGSVADVFETVSGGLAMAPGFYHVAVATDSGAAQLESVSNSDIRYYGADDGANSATSWLRYSVSWVSGDDLPDLTNETPTHRTSSAPRICFVA